MAEVTIIAKHDALSDLDIQSILCASIPHEASPFKGIEDNHQTFYGQLRDTMNKGQVLNMRGILVLPISSNPELCEIHWDIHDSDDWWNLINVVGRIHHDQALVSIGLGR